MRIVCLLLGVGAMGISGVFALFAIWSVSGIFGIRVEETANAPVAMVFALFGIAWMVASVAFRPVRRETPAVPMHTVPAHTVPAQTLQQQASTPYAG